MKVLPTISCMINISFTFCLFEPWMWSPSRPGLYYWCKCCGANAILSFGWFHKEYNGGDGDIEPAWPGLNSEIDLLPLVGSIKISLLKFLLRQ